MHINHRVKRTSLCDSVHSLRDSSSSVQTWPYLWAHLITVHCGNWTCSQYDSRSSGSTTRLSGYRENAGNRWETDLIMFSFFPISILWKVCSQPLSSFRNHSSDSISPPLRSLGVCVWVSLSLLCAVHRPPKCSVTFTPVQECLCLFMRSTKISCCWTKDQKKTGDVLLPLL